MPKTPLLPVFLKLEGRPVLLVGAGAVAFEKLPKLVEAKADLTLVAPQIGEQTRAFLDKHPGVEVVERAYLPSDCDNKFLVVAATDDGALNQSIFSSCRDKRILVNCADDPARCDFYLTGSVRKGPLTFVVSSEGDHPGLVRATRDFLEALIPDEHADALANLSLLRRQLRVLLDRPAERLAALRQLSHEISHKYFQREGERTHV